MACPECQAAVPVISGYINWCDRCNWNVKPPEETSRTTLQDRLNKRFGPAYERRLFDAVVGDRQSLEGGGFSLSRLLAYILAACVHVTTLFFGTLGLFLLVNYWPNIIVILLGLLSLAVAWVTFPRMDKPPDGVLDRNEYRALYGLVDRIAAELGLERVDGISVDHEFNASFRRVGWRGRNYFRIGLPLFVILTTEEKVALMGHEVAHGVNGDARRSVFVGEAVNSLMHWYDLLMPESLFSSESGIAGILMFPVNLLMVGLAKLARLGAYILLLLLYHDSQRAEYLADLLSTKVAGGKSMIGMLEKLYFGEFYLLTTQRLTLHKEKTLHDEFRLLIRETPERELERLRRVARLEGSRVDTTHPPTPLRIEFIRRRDTAAPIVVPDQEEERALEAEVMSLLPGVQKQLCDEYRWSLHY